MLGSRQLSQELNIPSLTDVLKKKGCGSGKLLHEITAEVQLQIAVLT